MSNELTTQLASLPSVLEANSSLADRAVLAVQPQLQAAQAVDLRTVDAATMEAQDEALAALQSKLRDTYTLMNDRRKPFTQRLALITGQFTEQEAKVTQIGKELKDVRDRWQAEKGRRNAEQAQKAAKALEAKQALIDARTYILTALADNMGTLGMETIKKMHQAFYEQAEATLPAYADKLAKWAPVLPTLNTGIINPKPQLIEQATFSELLTNVLAEQTPRMAAEWQKRMTTERDSLIEMVPSRISELQRIAGDAEAAKAAQERVAAEAKERQEAAERETKERKDALATAADVDKVNAAFDEVGEATPVVGISKGTVVRQTYKPASHKAWVALLQNWVTNDAQLMTLDELAKKLSFVKTACDKRLNAGTRIEADGLDVVEDYSTRSTKKTA